MSIVLYYPHSLLTHSPIAEEIVPDLPPLLLRSKERSPDLANDDEEE